MRRNLGLSSPVFEIPMEDNDLIIIGRIAVVWGQIIFELDGILLHLMDNLSVDTLREYPTRSLNRKLADLWRELSKPENEPHRKLLRDVHNAIDAASSDRNVVFHGLWGYWLKKEDREWIGAAKSYTRDDPFFLPSLKELHERVVRASELVADAQWILLVGDGEPPRNRNRLAMWTDGPPTDDGPPQPPRRPR